MQSKIVKKNYFIECLIKATKLEYKNSNFLFLLLDFANQLLASRRLLINPPQYKLNQCKKHIFYYLLFEEKKTSLRILTNLL